MFYSIPLLSVAINKLTFIQADIDFFLNFCVITLWKILIVWLYGLKFTIQTKQKIFIYILIKFHASMQQFIYNELWMICRI